MSGLPKDDIGRRVGSRARQLVHSLINVDDWEYHEITGVDRGFDCEIELILNDEFTGKRIIGQIKGTHNINFLKSGLIAFPLDVKTIQIGLNQPCPFVLFLADVDSAIVYYLPIQDYFIDRPELLPKLRSNQSTLTVHIDPTDVLDADNYILKDIAQCIYTGDSYGGYRRL